VNFAFRQCAGGPDFVEHLNCRQLWWTLASRTRPCCAIAQRFFRKPATLPPPLREAADERARHLQLFAYPLTSRPTYLIRRAIRKAIAIPGLSGCRSVGRECRCPMALGHRGVPKVTARPYSACPIVLKGLSGAPTTPPRRSRSARFFAKTAGRGDERTSNSGRQR